MSGGERDEITGTETTGHEWDGIRELNNPLPRWWLWTFYATVVWGIGYTIAFPAWPLVSGATAGVLGWSTRAAVAEEIRAVETAQTGQWAALLDADLAALREDDPDLHRFAVQAGAALFRTNCSQCHGAGAAGAVGYPNLLDDDWLWGGEIEEIAHTIRHGIRNEEDPETRFSQMPGFGDFLGRDEIRSLVAHVRALPEGADPEAGPAGALFADNCASCHGADARGDRSIGAPDLTDAIWLYGDAPETLTRVIAEGPYGVMPGWGGRLDEAELRALASYVHQLGGGEAEERRIGAAPGSAAEPG
ncbi:cytochrome-c oxidase, cbb3-type subunit III [Limimaricola pyoseonensis]|uniref:Cbb3-type cytochrome c oxidase subunit n=1 Tax=Limimaricola pyoseonensis TaxID=521013 RepID=A0A1G7CDI0_9RHOB|nr:cytochrome-c oxidase, cbb3-type subunit III [Limimaricola pyoseonensis]SDE37351.1 cytochrome c oxidase cbb3-type subunit 3 [Limimaricola pyoseonensis]